MDGAIRKLRRRLHERCRNVRFGSCVDGAALARTFWVAAALVGCGHVSGLFVRRWSHWP